MSWADHYRDQADLARTAAIGWANKGHFEKAKQLLTTANTYEVLAKEAKKDEKKSEQA